MYYEGKFPSARKSKANDRFEAVICYGKAAKLGLAIAQLKLGVMYLKGKGVKKNLDEAAKWFGEAAKQGDAEAIRRLAKLKN